MTPGQLVDYVIEWNDIHSDEDGEHERGQNVRKATQADWDALFG